jgi:hypothetical protein
MNQREERLRFLAEGAQNRVSSKVGRHLVVSIPRVRIRPAAPNSPHFSPFPRLGLVVDKRAKGLSFRYGLGSYD